MSLLAAVVWHWWISVALVVGAVGAVIATVAGYFAKVERMKHPNGRRR